MTVRLEQLANPTACDLEQIERIYLASFDLEERDPFESVVRALENGWIAMVARGADAAIVGFMMLVPLPDVSIVYMPYFALDPAQRGQGIGSRLFRYTMVHLVAQTPYKALVWEVEAGVLRSLDDNCSRRLRFYERQGGEFLPYTAPYRVPNLAGPGMLPMSLMWLPVARGRWPLRQDEVIVWVRALYAQAYPHYAALGDRIVAEMAGCGSGGAL